MILCTNNTAASMVIDTIGYPYINRLLREAGFYHPASKLGLWISGNYRGGDWVRGFDLMPLTPRGKKHYQATSNFVATSREVAPLLTLAQLNSLFVGDANTCVDMIRLMRKNNPADPAGPGTASSIARAVGLP